MARSLPLAMTVIVLVVFFHVFLPPPLVLSAAVRPPGGRIGRYSVRPEQATKIRKFLIKHAGDLVDIILNILPSKDKSDNLESAASTAGLYIFNIPVGTSPPQVLTGVLDIALSFIWAQCERCNPCLPPPAPTFQWSASPTFSTLPCASETCQSVLSQTCPGDDDTAGCGYTVTYGDGGTTNTTGYLANDTFTFGASPVPGVVFGCSLASYGAFSGASGTFGFGRGALSLVSQLQLSWFSYRLASDDPGSDNLLLFGDDDAVPRSKRSRSTRLLRNSVYPDLYYVKLTGIQVGGQDLTGIPAGTFDFQADGSGGVFLITTSPVTYLEEAAYKVVRQAFVRGIASEPVNGSALGLDLCYMMQSIDEIKVPKLTLVFDGANAAMELKKHNYFFADNATGLECLTILPSRGGSLLGSLMQTDTNMTYDIDGAQLIFERAFARSPRPEVFLMVVVSLVAWVLSF